MEYRREKENGIIIVVSILKGYLSGIYSFFCWYYDVFLPGQN